MSVLDCHNIRFVRMSLRVSNTSIQIFICYRLAFLLNQLVACDLSSDATHRIYPSSSRFTDIAINPELKEKKEIFES